MIKRNLRTLEKLPLTVVKFVSLNQINHERFTICYVLKLVLFIHLFLLSFQPIAKLKITINLVVKIGQKCKAVFKIIFVSRP